AVIADRLESLSRSLRSTKATHSRQTDAAEEHASLEPHLLSDQHLARSRPIPVDAAILDPTRVGVRGKHHGCRPGRRLSKTASFCSRTWSLDSRQLWLPTGLWQALRRRQALLLLLPLLLALSSPNSTPRRTWLLPRF